LYGDRFNIEGPLPKIDFLHTNNLTISPLYFDNLLGWMPSFRLGGVDMMGNNKVAGGIAFRVADIIRSPSYRAFAEYSFLGFRVDLKLRYDRTIFYYDSNYDFCSLDKLEGSISYPLSNTSRVSIIPFIAKSYQTNNIVTATSSASGIFNSMYGGYRMEFVHDNTLNHGPNQLQGTRIKLLWENYYSDVSANNFGRIQGEIRHYERIHNELTLATRLVAGSFFGPNAQQYVLGGMDNSPLGTSNDTKNKESPLLFNNIDNRNLLFMQYATNMRGFDYGAFSGNDHFLFNAELRWPIVRYFYKGTISSSTLKNLMLIGFYDAGSAWSGNLPFYIPYLNPNGRDNSINVTYPIAPNTSSYNAIVYNYKNPILQGFGLGVRTFIFGYYVKLDFAWGVRDYNINPLRVYLSLGYDF
jgi:hypothetical protein